MMKKRTFAACLMALFAWWLAAAEMPCVKIDFNMYDRQLAEINEPGYQPWAVNLAPSDSMVFTAANDASSTIKIVVKSLNGNDLYPNYYKAGVQSPYYARLVCDGICVSGGNGAKIEMRIMGLPVGKHSFQTFHNIWDKVEDNAASKLRVYVNGVKKYDRVPCSVRKLTTSEATILQTTAEVLHEGDAVVLCFEALPDKQVAASNRNVWINAIEINTTDFKKSALEPVPADVDLHVDADDGNLTLRWKPAADAVSHRLFLGTDMESVQKAQESSPEHIAVLSAADTCYTLKDLYSMNTYYWRVDEVDANGLVTKGEVWRFRPRQLAFRGAEGYGRFATGGRGGKVVYVTNLNDSGPGSLREAVTADIGPRTVVFAVSGRIQLKDRLVMDKYVTIAGQTAPGKGICVSRAPMGSGNECITRFIRVRLGGGPTADGFGMAGNNHSIIDHCSISWAIDEVFSSRGAHNITLQHTMITEALNVAGHMHYGKGKAHGYAGTIGGNVGSFHHNLLAHNEGRNWSMGGGLDGDGYYAGRLDIFNNLVYNWDGRTTDGGAHEVNFVNNYYKRGPAGGVTTMLTAQLEGTGKGSQSYYYAGNVLQDNDGSYLCDGTDNTCGRKVKVYEKQVLDWEVWANQPFFPSYAHIESAKDAYKHILSNVGCNMPVYDEQDLRVLKETQDGTYTYVGSKTAKKGLIDNEADAGGFEDYGNEVRPENYDSDWDGLPDWWEILHGSNPNSPEGDFSDSNADIDKDGYTALEDYLEWMAVPHYFLTADEKCDIDVAAYFKGFTQSPVYTLSLSSPVAAKVEGSKIRLTPEVGFSGITYMDVTVRDAENSSMTRRIGLCVKAKEQAKPARPLTNGLLGWAIYDDGDGFRGITGGGNGRIVRVSTRSELEEYAKAEEAYTILITRSITGGGTIYVTSNKTLIGVGPYILFDNVGIRAGRAENIIIRNITIKNAAPDALAFQNCRHVWVDHCDLSSSSDGLLDYTIGSDFLTVSYTKLHHHNKVSICNSGTGHFEDAGKNKVSYHHNWFDANVQRNPRIGYGMGHVFNNYYTDISMYCVGYFTGAEVLVENNYFHRSNTPLRQMYSSESTDPSYARAEARGNIFDETSGNTEGTGKVYNPEDYYEYAFSMENAKDVPAVVKSWCGPVSGLEYEYYPVPGNGAIDVFSPVLTWTGIENVQSWMVYFGTSEASMLKHRQIVTDRSYRAEKLKPETTYYWRVDAVCKDTVIEGGVWRFRTASKKAFKPYPLNDELHADLREAVSRTECSPLTIRWKQAMDAVKYKVYMDTLPHLTEKSFKAEVQSTHYTPEALKYGKTYYWRVSAILPDGKILKGDTWHFCSNSCYSTVGKTEAEDMVRNGRVWVETQDGSKLFKASGNKATVGESGSGSLSSIWNAPDATCQVDLTYLDESDGRATYHFYVNDSLIETWRATENTDEVVTHTIKAVKICRGDELRIAFTVQGGEPCRIDYMTVRAEQ